MDDLRKLKDDATKAFSKGKLAKAVELYEEICKQDPKDLPAQIKLGDALVKAGNKGKAVLAYQRVAEAYANGGFLPKSIALCKVILELDPQHSDTQQILARLYAKKMGAAPRSSPLSPPPPEVPAPRPAPPPRSGAAQAIELEPPGEAGPALELDTADHADAGFGTSPAAPGGHGELDLAPAEHELAPAGSPRAWRPEDPLELEIVRSPARPQPAVAALSSREAVVAAAAAGLQWGSSSGGDSIEAQLAQAADQVDPVTALPTGDVAQGAIESLDIEFDVPAAPGAEEEIEILSVTAEVKEVGHKDAGRELPKIPLFSDLPQDAFVELMERCGFIRAEAGQPIIAEGEGGNSFFVVCSGKMKVVKRAEDRELVMAYLTEGAFFGEMALLSGSRRAASVIAEEGSELLEISAPTLNQLARRHPQVASSIKQFGRQRLLANVMATSALFRPFERADRRRLIELFKVREVKQGERMMKEGEQTDGLYVVMSGELEVSRGGAAQVVARLGEGELFGEMSLLSKKPASATVSARRRSTVLRLPRERFEELIVTYPQALMLVSDLADARTRNNAQARSLSAEAGAPVA